MKNNLKQIRTQNGWSLRSLSEFTNIPYRTLQDFENGNISNTSYENLFLLADALTCRIEDIVILPVYKIVHHTRNVGDEVVYTSESRKIAIIKYCELYQTKKKNKTDSFERYTILKDNNEIARFQLEKVGDKIIVKHSYNNELISIDPICEKKK